MLSTGDVVWSIKHGKGHVMQIILDGTDTCCRRVAVIDFNNHELRGKYTCEGMACDGHDTVTKWEDHDKYHEGDEMNWLVPVKVRITGVSPYCVTTEIVGGGRVITPTYYDKIHFYTHNSKYTGDQFDNPEHGFLAGKDFKVTSSMEPDFQPLPCDLQKGDFVLYRDDVAEEWKLGIFYEFREGVDLRFRVVNHAGRVFNYRYCIKYLGNENRIGEVK